MIGTLFFPLGSDFGQLFALSFRLFSKIVIRVLSSHDDHDDR